MRTPALIVCCLICSNLCFAQPRGKSHSNALSIEVGKTGLIYNLGYDRRFGETGFGVRAVAGMNFSKYLRASGAGAGGYYLVGKRGSLELGIDLQYLSIDEVSDDQKGFAFVYPDYTTNTYYVSVNIGYRLYGNGSLFRVGFSPGYIRNEFVPGGYISYGFTF